MSVVPSPTSNPIIQPESFVSVRALRVEYKERRRAPGRRPIASRAVDDVSFDIPRGGTLGLVGESGCGKTSVARAVLRLIEPAAGEIHVAGVNVRALRGESLRRHRRRMQMVFQDPFTSLNPRLTIGDAIAEGLVVHGLATTTDAIAQAARLLEQVELDPADARRYPHELSGGQRQRAAIARALAVGPEFVVLDEAVSALDVTTQARILELIARLRVTHGLTCLFIAHNLAVVQQVATSVAVMYLGRIVELAPADRLFAAPRHPYTRALLAAVPSLDPGARRTRVPLTDDPRLAEGARSGCAFYARCPHPAKDAICTTVVPPLRSVGPDHAAACIKESGA